MNASKTKSMAYNIKKRMSLWLSRNGVTCWNKSKDFKYLGSWVDESEKRLQDLQGPYLEGMQQNAHTLEINPACLLEGQLPCRRRKYITVRGRRMDNKKRT